MGRSAIIRWAGRREASQASTAFARTCEGDVTQTEFSMLSVRLHQDLWHSFVDVC
jgi:hypothetical protein